MILQLEGLIRDSSEELAPDSFNMSQVSDPWVSQVSPRQNPHKDEILLDARDESRRRPPSYAPRRIKSESVHQEIDEVLKDITFRISLMDVIYKIKLCFCDEPG